MPDRHGARDAVALWRDEIEGQRDHVRHMAGERGVEDPDAGLESEQREAPFRIGARREGALPEIVAARETKERFDPRLRGLARIAAPRRDAARHTPQRLSDL